jgi:MtN3 and saliva related transmembrane protein
MSEIIGWSSSLILVATLGKQIHKQWREKTSEGISTWLFIGQLVASTGFVIYSAMTGNIVFVFTNSVLTFTNLIGLFLYYRYRTSKGH